MSKPLSNLFHGTTGEINYPRSQQKNEGDIIKERVQGLDLREHPVKHKSSLSLKAIRKKIKERTASREDYRKYNSLSRLKRRRQKGVNEFWKQERRRIKNGEPTTRNWTIEQRQAIIQSRRPSVNGKSLQGHHTYSVSKYPHLANKGEVVFPVTFKEHLYDWHGRNFQKSLPGRPFKRHKKVKGE